MKQAIKINQIWKQKNASFQLLVTGKKGGKWLCKVLTKRPGVYNGSHAMSERTLWIKFDLLP